MKAVIVLPYWILRTQQGAPFILVSVIMQQAKLEGSTQRLGSLLTDHLFTAVQINRIFSHLSISAFVIAENTIFTPQLCRFDDVDLVLLVMPLSPPGSSE
ncbi:MAG: hypothetical protein ACI86X_000613 [Moritella sp.]|jgi:hypothetical protein